MRRFQFDPLLKIATGGGQFVIHKKPSGTLVTRGVPRELPPALAELNRQRREKSSRNR